MSALQYERSSRVEPVLFGSEYQRRVGFIAESRREHRGRMGQKKVGLIGLATGPGSGAGDKGAIGHGLCQCGGLARAVEQVAPITERASRQWGSIGRNHREAPEAEVGHGPCSRLRY